MKKKLGLAGLVTITVAGLYLAFFRTGSPDALRLPTPTPGPSITVPKPNPPATIRIPDFSADYPFDAIPPIYAPVFANAVDSPLLDEELVLGVVFDGRAKAYPVTVLRFREIVNDELAGIPILVTW